MQHTMFFQFACFCIPHIKWPVLTKGFRLFLFLTNLLNVNKIHYKTTCSIAQKCLIIKHFFLAHLNTCILATLYKSHIISHIPLIMVNVLHQSVCLKTIFAKQLQSLRLFNNRKIKKSKDFQKVREWQQCFMICSLVLLSKFTF